MQSRSSFRTASSLFNNAIRDFLNNLTIVLSKVGFCGLGFRAMLTPEDNAEDVGVMAVGGIRCERGRE